MHSYSMEPVYYLKQVDLYCERTNGAFWAEPVNAVSNFGFLIAAYALLKLSKSHAMPQERRILVMRLIALVGVIGVGSFLFHTFATVIAAMADVIPIGLFILFYLYVFGRVVLGLTDSKTYLLMLALIVINAAFPLLLPRMPDGIVSYLPSFLFLLGLSFFLLWKKHPSGSVVLFTALLAFLSLTFRTLDLEICNAAPLGTHFIWHLLNACVLYLLVRTVILCRSAPS